MTMTKKHYKMFADAIGRLKSKEERESMVNFLSPLFLADNRRFDLERFTEWIRRVSNGESTKGLGWMKIEDFKEILRKTKGIQQHYVDVSIVYYKDLNRKKIYAIKTCSKCKQSIRKSITVDFFTTNEHLTVFQAQLLYCVFVLNKKPFDYANYHKGRGKEFIENIKNVMVEWHSVITARLNWRQKTGLWIS